MNETYTRKLKCVRCFGKLFLSKIFLAKTLLQVTNPYSFNGMDEHCKGKIPRVYDSVWFTHFNFSTLSFLSFGGFWVNLLTLNIKEKRI